MAGHPEMTRRQGTQNTSKTEQIVLKDTGYAYFNTTVQRFCLVAKTILLQLKIFNEETRNHTLAVSLDARTEQREQEGDEKEDNRADSLPQPPPGHIYPEIKGQWLNYYFFLTCQLRNNE